MTHKVEWNRAAVVEDETAQPDLVPNVRLVAAATCTIGVLSFLFLPWPAALASTLLGLVMAAGADVDARTYLLPDTITYGALACGLVAVPLCDLSNGTALSAAANFWLLLGEGGLRAAATAFLLYGLRAVHMKFRGVEGIGLGDVKLAAGVGAWLTVAAIPYCFFIATAAALVFVIFNRRKPRGADAKLPFGAFLCPALWLSFFVTALPR